MFPSSSVGVEVGHEALLAVSVAHGSLSIAPADRASDMNPVLPHFNKVTTTLPNVVHITSGRIGFKTCLSSSGCDMLRHTWTPMKPLQLARALAMLRRLCRRLFRRCQSQT